MQFAHTGSGLYRRGMTRRGAEYADNYEDSLGPISLCGAYVRCFIDSHCRSHQGMCASSQVRVAPCCPNEPFSRLRSAILQRLSLLKSALGS